MNSGGKLFADIVCESTFRQTAERLLTKSGVRSDLRGYFYLIDAIILYGTGCTASFCDIYNIVSEMRGIKTKTIVREITYCVAQSKEIVNKLPRLLGISVKATELCSSMVIAGLGELFKRPDPSLYD